MRRIFQLFPVTAPWLLLAVLTVAHVHAQCTPPPSGMVGWWKGDGSGSDFLAANNGTLVNVAYTNGVVGSAFAFDPENFSYGTYTGLQIADQPAYALTNALTIEGWVRPRGPGYYIFSAGTTDRVWIRMASPCKATTPCFSKSRIRAATARKLAPPLPTMSGRTLPPRWTAARER